MNGDLGEFVRFLRRESNDYLEALAARESEKGLPIIKWGMRDLLMVLMVMAKPVRILELGTCGGFSAVFMGTYAPEEAHITTVEINPKLHKRALKNIEEAGMGDKISAINMDAADFLKEDKGNPPYDFIFVDCAKGQYTNLWEDIRRRIRQGGIVITDDVLQKGSLPGSRFLLNRRDRTIHKRLRKYVHKQLNDPDFTGGVFKIDDGVSILVRDTK